MAQPPDTAAAPLQRMMLSSSNARLASARRLTSRKGRREAGRFLAEGAPAVQAALAAGAVIELYATAQAADRHPELTDSACEISTKDAAALSDTTTPQGLVAVCAIPRTDLAGVFAPRPQLVLALVEPNDPGNVGTIIRTADAAGADAVILSGGGVDPYNGKVVRASAGSLFHLPVRECGTADLLAAASAAGMSTLATSGSGSVGLDDLERDGTLAAPTLWMFGTEAHGLPVDIQDAADRAVRIPIYGHAESLNLAAAAAVCAYASARAQRTTR